MAQQHPVLLWSAEEEGCGAQCPRSCFGHNRRPARFAPRHLELPGTTAASHPGCCLLHGPSAAQLLRRRKTKHFPQRGRRIPPVSVESRPQEPSSGQSLGARLGLTCGAGSNDAALSARSVREKSPKGTELKLTAAPPEAPLPHKSRPPP